MSSALLVFAFVASITPGPTNILVLANGARHGFAATLPLVAGAAIGAAGIVWVAGTGLAVPLTAYPVIRQAMTVAGLIWLTSLAWKLFHRADVNIDTHSAHDKPERQGALTGASLQLVNPKTWMMAFAVIGVFMAAAR